MYGYARPGEMQKTGEALTVPKGVFEKTKTNTIQWPVYTSEIRLDLPGSYRARALCVVDSIYFFKLRDRRSLTYVKGSL